VCAAFVQLYREDAWYLERTAPWIERVGLDYVKAALFDDADSVRRLAARFRFSQTFMQDDPWAERAAGKHAELHQHLAEVRPLSVAPLEYAK
jgi:nitrite reductase (NADH) large subunit